MDGSSKDFSAPQMQHEVSSHQLESSMNSSRRFNEQQMAKIKRLI